MKKLLALILALAMCFSLVACGGEGKKDEAGKPAASQGDSDKKEDAGTFTLEGVEYSYTDFPKSDIVIAMVNDNNQNAWRSNLIKSWEECCEEMKSVGLIADYYTYNVQGEEAALAAINDCINKGVNAICGPLTLATYGPTFQTALDAGIKLLSTGNGGIPESVGENFVVLDGDNDEYMRGPTEFLCAAMGYKGKVVHLYGREGGWDGGEIRKEAVRETIAKYPDMEIIHGQGVLWSNADANAAMTTLLATYGDELGGDKVGVVAEDVGLGVLQAYTAAGVDFPVLVGDYTIGFMREAAKYPDLKFVSNCYAADCAYTFAHTAYLMCTGREVDPEKAVSLRGDPWTIVYPMPCVVVREYDENDEWVKNLKPTTEVRLLDDIIAWAEEEGLSDNDCILGHLPISEVVSRYFK